VKVFAVQLDIAWEQKAANFQKAESLVRSAAPPAGSMIALPELFATGFSMNSREIAEDPGGLTEQFLRRLARERDCYVLGGLAVRGTDGTIQNQALAVSPQGNVLARYAKMRPFSPGQEDRYYQAGIRPSAFQAGDCRVAPFVCYDLRFPELFRSAAAACAPELYVVIASWPEKRVQHWVRLLQARAIENQAFVLGVNRVGSDPAYSYQGRSICVNADGDIIADAGNQETVTAAELDFLALRKYRAGLPFLRDLKAQSLDFGSPTA
jgi:predicted amidohydrolase